MECQADSDGYKLLDVFDEQLEEKEEKNITLKTKCDVKKLCESINQNSTESECKACISNNAGKYLCEYIYYNSLCLEEPLSLFVHIPHTDIYTSEKTAQGLLKILIYLIECYLEKECLKK